MKIGDYDGDAYRHHYDFSPAFMRTTLEHRFEFRFEFSVVVLHTSFEVRSRNRNVIVDQHCWNGDA